MSGADNDYFRSLLNQPREIRKSAAAPISEGAGPSKEGGGERKKSGKSGTFVKKGGPKQAPADEGGEDDDKQLYRDRAEERRKGLNPDYDDAGLYSGAEAASVFVAPGLDKLSEEERKRIEIENSKYLGGDEKNTHRVKGLDYALLNRIRSKIDEEDFQDATEVLPAHKANKVPSAGPTAAAQTLLAQEKMTFSTGLGRAIYSAVFERPGGSMAEHFQPKRMSFVFELGEDEQDEVRPEVPTTLHRAKEDCPAAQETLMGAMDTTVLERFSRIMSYLRVNTSSRHGRRLKKQERQHILQGLLKGEIGLEEAQKEEERRVRELEDEERREEERLQLAAQGIRLPGGGGGRGQAAKAAVDDEDIFGDAGTDYTPSVIKKESGSGATRPKFDTSEIYGSLPPVAQHGGDRMDKLIDVPGAPAVPPPPPPPPAAGEDERAYYDRYYEAHGYYYEPGSDSYMYSAPQGTYGPSRPPVGDEEEPVRIPADPRALPQDARDGGLATVFRQGDPSKWRRRKLTDDERKLLLVQEDEEEEKDLYYAETVVDPTEDVSDAALLKMRMNPVTNVDYWTGDVGDEEEEDGKKSVEKSRYDFASEEDWQKYKQETVQKGGKKGDGRFGQKDVAKQKEAKLGTKLTQIRNVLKEKGFEKDDVAFINPEKIKKGDAGAKRDLPAETPGPERAKKLRLK